MNESDIRKETEALVKESFPELAEQAGSIADETIEELKENGHLGKDGQGPVMPDGD